MRVLEEIFAKSKVDRVLLPRVSYKFSLSLKKVRNNIKQPKFTHRQFLECRT